MGGSLRATPSGGFLMSNGWKTIVLAAAGAVTLASAAQASEVNITIASGSSAQPQRIADYNGDGSEHRDYWRREDRYEDRNQDNGYGRPAPEWRERWHHWGGYNGPPVAERP